MMMEKLSKGVRKMSSKTTIWIIAVVLAIASAGAVYFLTSNQYKPIIDQLEEEKQEVISQSIQLNESISELLLISSDQNNTIEELLGETVDLQSTVSALEAIIEELERSNSETSSDLEKYRSFAKEFYNMHPIQIGFTSPTTNQLIYTEKIAEMVENDINAYCTKEKLPYKFEFKVSNNAGDNDIALSNLITYNTLGINLVVGPFGDSQCQTSVDFANDNDMILISPSSDVVELSLADNLFRMVSNESRALEANIACMKKLNIKHIVIFAQNDDWGKDLSSVMEGLSDKAGISSWSLFFSPDPKMQIYSQLNYLNSHLVNASAFYGSEHVAVQIICNSRLEDVLNCGAGSSVIEFGVTDTVYLDIEDKSVNTLLMAPIPYTKENKFSEFRDRVLENYNFNVTYYGATAYDACWLYALSVIDAGSLDTDAVKSSLLIVSSEYDGVSGVLSLDNSGDRFESDYMIMGFSQDSGFKEYGYYSYSNQTVNYTYNHYRLNPD